MKITLNRRQAMLAREAVATVRHGQPCAKHYAEQIPVPPKTEHIIIDVPDALELQHALADAEVSTRFRRLAQDIFWIRCKVHDEARRLGNHQPTDADDALEGATPPNQDLTFDRATASSPTR